ncbi:MAG: cytochrome c-type biogenesis protein CcmH [Zoogloeaceae bacterium]|jgi:cytochrome c-type biogenesis protein CcmH|nr:cytochrome c-type biogenesis protein CcmH [Zoogloeaceae bacterium]
MKKAYPGIFLFLVAFFASGIALASEVQQRVTDPVTEKRLHAIAGELRCLVCQNETIAASNADLARDLRREIRARIASGQSDREILDFLTTRYGDFVRYRPPLNPVTLFLWFGPLFFLLAGGVILRRYLKHRQRVLQAAPPLSVEERRAAEALLAAPPDAGNPS